MIYEHVSDSLMRMVSFPYSRDSVGDSTAQYGTSESWLVARNNYNSKR